MIKINKYLRLNVLAVLLIVFLTVNVYGTDFKPVAEEMIGASGISWAPKVSYSRLVVTISRPDGTTFRKSFDSGSSPYVDLSSIFGESYLDGSYTYELVVVPFEKRVRGIEEKRRDKREWHNKGLTQSGSFFIQGGAIVPPDIAEPNSGAGLFSGAQEGLSGAKDIQHLDDVIISFSLCVGNDCVNGESFGFDTLRLKENNLRIHFQDTSNSASFPTNDWRIVANDSDNGGANYLAIEDSDTGRKVFKVLAGAPANSLYVDADGDVGFGTSAPVVDAHIVSGNTPTLRLEQNGSSGFTPQTWDLAGNEANFFIRDVTNSSKLPFKIKPGAPTSSIFVAADGDIGLGTESPDASLNVNAGGDSTAMHVETNSSTDAVVMVERSGGAIAQIAARTDKTMIGSRSSNRLNLTVGNVPKMTIDTNDFVGIGDETPSFPLEVGTANGAHVTTGGVWTNGSSREFKENIKNLTSEEAVKTLEGLNPVKYKYKVEKEEEYVGFIAEEVPELVATNSKKYLSPMDIVAVLTKVVQEQQNTISELKEKVEKLEKDSK